LTNPPRGGLLPWWGTPLTAHLGLMINRSLGLVVPFTRSEKQCLRKKCIASCASLLKTRGYLSRFLGLGRWRYGPPGDGSDIAVAVASLIIGILLRLGALVMDLLEPLALGEAAATPESGEDKSE
jgi:hypothetical protein